MDNEASNISFLSKVIRVSLMLAYQVHDFLPKVHDQQLRDLFPAYLPEMELKRRVLINMDLTLPELTHSKSVLQL